MQKFVPVCFFFWRTGEPQQRWLYPQRAPSASRLGTVASSLNGAVSFCCSLEGGGPSDTARREKKQRSIKEYCVKIGDCLMRVMIFRNINNQNLAQLEEINSNLGHEGILINS